VAIALGATALNADSENQPATAATSDFTRSEPFEAMSGGEATSASTSINHDAFSQPSGNLDFRREFDFRIGNGIFRKLWVSAPSSTESSDGLGPLYNARACQRCHLKDGRGHPPGGNWPDDDAVSMLMRLSIPPQNEAERLALAEHIASNIPEPTYGGQLQDFAIQGLNAEGRIEITYEEQPIALSDGETVSLRAPTYAISDLGYGDLHPDTQMSPRIANPMIGLGLLEAIDEADILALADPDDSDGDGVSGRPNYTWSVETNGVELGRFGWKAGQPSVRQQAAGAFAGDIGISTSLFPAGAADCTELQTACTGAPDGNTPRLGNVEASDTMLDLVVFYSRNLAVPPRRDIDDPQVLAGKQLFYASGCIGCHVPKFVTGDDALQAEFADQLIWPYTDLLLHDMGDGLADNRREGAASGREWRTPPLWGIGLTETVSGHTFFLHDGRARTLLEAILWHGGEAEAARQQVIDMDAQQRQHLIRFLESL
jgi:CxxC motif-containing protein (DUF1111 family)